MRAAREITDAHDRVNFTCCSGKIGCLRCWRRVPARRKGIVWLWACLVAWQLTACQGSKPLPTVTIAPEVSPQPARVGEATITLRLTDGSGKAVSGARVALEGNMSHAGMGPVFSEAKELEPGRYRSSLELSMAGDWIVLVHLTLSDGQKLERQFEIKGVRSD